MECFDRRLVFFLLQRGETVGVVELQGDGLLRRGELLIGGVGRLGNFIQALQAFLGRGASLVDLLFGIGIFGVVGKFKRLRAAE